MRMVRHRHHLHNAHHRHHLHHLTLMKNKTPQKGQLWVSGATVYRVIRNEGDKTHAHNHGKMGLFYTRTLKVATPSQVAEYLGKE